MLTKVTVSTANCTANWANYLAAPTVSKLDIIECSLMFAYIRSLIQDASLLSYLEETE